MPSAHYKQYFALSYSGMQHLEITPAHWKAWHQNPNRKETRAMALGTLMHLLLLQPHREATEVKVWDESRQTNAWKAFKKEHEGRIITDSDELKQGRLMVSSALKNTLIQKGFRQQGQAELEFFGIDPEFDCPIKCTFDWITDDLIFDPKKTGNTIREFERSSIWDYDYHVQAAFYLRCAEIMDGKSRQFAWPVIEDAPPYAAQLILPPQSILDEGKRKVEDMLRIFSRCIKENDWPGYNDEMKIAEVPEWVLRKMAV